MVAPKQRLKWGGLPVLLIVSSVQGITGPRTMRNRDFESGGGFSFISLIFGDLLNLTESIIYNNNQQPVERRRDGEGTGRVGATVAVQGGRRTFLTHCM